MLRWGILAILTLLLICFVSRLSYKEDISDFLPLGTSDREALSIYQDISGADQVIVIFDNPDDEEMTVQAMELFCEEVRSRDTIGIADNIIAKFDIEELTKISDFVYSNIPYFLTEADYERIDSLLSNSSYVSEQLNADREMLMFLSGGLLSRNISRDPLNLFTPVVSRLNKAHRNAHFESYEGYIFSPDLSKSVLIVPSPFGNSETENNAKVISLLDEGVSKVKQEFPQIGVHLTGGPQIAVGNARQIKQDSLLAVSIAFVLIILLLLYSFRSVRNIGLIVVSIAWGWFFALGCVSIIHSDISIIVIGISSIIIGIAVNYPLHLIDHAIHESQVKKSLSEIVTPLVVGNVTTIGAFLTLVPLKSLALRDLGLFASLLLLGTIVFVLVFLPHWVRVNKTKKPAAVLFRSLVEIKVENKRWLLWIVVVLTLVFAWFSFQTEFDSDMSNINYMTEDQRADMEYFQTLLAPAGNDSSEILYVVSSAANMDEALRLSRTKSRVLDTLRSAGLVTGIESASAFIPSAQDQAHRLQKWREMVKRYESLFGDELAIASNEAGFRAEAFSDFHHMISSDYEVQGFDYFSPLTQSVFKDNFSSDPSQARFSVVDKVFVPTAHLNSVKQRFAGSFDVKSMNSAIANSLSADFNYIGLACSLIVFFFLWFSFGRIELALIAFLPMAISWIWILGLMAILGVKFNIVNIILATFIFGQGDDYTIFITEGCSYEYAYRKPMLSSYKNSIIISALIMFIGIGSLIVAKHPAMRSLAEVTIIGMFCVVLMAYLIPPFIFNWMTRTRGRFRKRPLTLGSLARTSFCGLWWLVQLAIGYILGFLLFSLFGRKKRTKWLFHRIVTFVHRLDIRLFPGVRTVIDNPEKENFEKPCVIVCNHQSMLDPMYLMALSPRIILVANRRSSLNPIIRRMFRWLDFYTISEDEFEKDIPLLQSFVDDGYSIAIYAEGERNPESSVLRFHKGAFMLAARTHLDILPIYLHGLNNVMPIHSFASNPGAVSVVVGRRITPESPLWDEEYSEMTRRVHHHYTLQYQQLKQRVENASYFVQMVKERYIYKGAGIYAEVRRAFSHDNLQWVDESAESPSLLIPNCGSGALALLAALAHPTQRVYALEEDADRRQLALGSARGLVKNLDIIPSLDSIPSSETVTVFNRI